MATGTESRNTTGVMRIRSSTQRCTTGGTPGRASSRMWIAYSQTAVSAIPAAMMLAA